MPQIQDVVNRSRSWPEAPRLAQRVCSLWCQLKSASIYTEQKCIKIKRPVHQSLPNAICGLPLLLFLYWDYLWVADGIIHRSQSKSQGTFLLGLGKLPKPFSCGAGGMMDAPKKARATPEAGTARGEHHCPWKHWAGLCQRICRVECWGGGKDTFQAWHSQFLQSGCGTQG